MKFFNRVRQLTATTGVGDTITLGSAFSNAFLTLAEAGGASGDLTIVVVEQGTDFALYRVTVGASAGSVTITSVLKSKIGGTAGTSRLNLDGSAVVRAVETAEDLELLNFVTPRVRVATTGNVDLSTGLEAGDVQDGVTLAAGDWVLVWQQSTASQNGIRQVPASGAASRAPGFTTYDAHAGLLVTVQEGTLNHDRVFLCTSDKGGTIDSTALTFVDQTTPAASTSTPGIVELATQTETQTGTDSTRAVTPAGLASIVKFAYNAILADDTAAFVQLPTPNFIGFGLIQTNSTGLSALFTFETVAPGSLSPMVEGTAGATLDWTTGVLAGTTGVDTHFTVSIDTATDRLYFENRLGGQQIVQLILFGG